jgi:hypothetical protein
MGPSSPQVLETKVKNCTLAKPRKSAAPKCNSLANLLATRPPNATPSQIS